MKTKEQETHEQLVDRVLAERTPDPTEVQHEMRIAFLDPDGKLMREEQAKVVALADRTLIRHEILADMVISERGKTTTVDGEKVSRLSGFFLKYGLSARESKKIAHTSVLEQVNPGPEQFGGDSPIVMQGISGLLGYYLVGQDTYSSLEAVSTRGAVWLADHFYTDPSLPEKTSANLAAINRDIHAGYMDLTRRAALYYAETTEKRPDEKDFEYEWRVLSMALDDARQVTNLSWKCQLALHSNNAQALRGTIVRLGSSELPEARTAANQLRTLGELGLPTLMRYTQGSEHTHNLPGRIRQTVEMLGLKQDRTRENRAGRARFVEYHITPDSERLALRALLESEYSGSGRSVARVVNKLSDSEVASQLGEFARGLTVHDRLPGQLNRLRISVTEESSLGAIMEGLRHRAFSHTISPLSPVLGFTVPEAYVRLGLTKEYKENMMLNRRAWHLVADLGPQYEPLRQYNVARGDLHRHTFEGGFPGIVHYQRLRNDDGAHPDIHRPASGFEKALRSDHQALVDTFLVRN